MNEMAFAVHLGGGLYMDSKGDLHQGMPPDVPIYEVGTGNMLPIDPKVVKDALNDVKQALKDINDPDSGVREKFEEWGFDTKLLDILGAVGKIAGMVAPVFAALSLAVDLAKMFGFLKAGPSALELLVNQRFDELEDHVYGVSQLINIQDVRDGRIDVELFWQRVRSYCDQLENLNPSVAQLENDRLMLQNTYNARIHGVATLLDSQTWMASFNREEHTRAWPWMQHALFTLPGSPGTAPVPAPLPPDGALRFDHRYMVALAPYAAEGYLACIRGLTPEYRSTGDYYGTLVDFAKKLHKLAKTMRASVLARTIYEPEHFAWPMVELKSWEIHNDSLGMTPQHLIKISPRCSRWPVGAMDLRYHNDIFFGDFLTSLLKSEFFGWPSQTKYGNMDFRWIPSARLERANFDRIDGWTYRITDPDECASAANAQSERDYADLLARSGYTQLVQLATLFRNEVTEPSKSQTVKHTGSSFYRKPKASSQVTVESDDILLTGVIQSPATREPQDYWSRVAIWTQSIKRVRPIEYKIKLRTLKSIVSNKRWRERPYSEYQWAEYEKDPDPTLNDPDDPGFLRLVLYTSDAVLDEHAIKINDNEWSSSPREPIKISDTAEMKAHTFDWWIPVKQPYSLQVPFEETQAYLRSLGWSGLEVELKGKPLAGMMGTMSLDGINLKNAVTPSIVDFVPKLSWKDGAQDWDGERRDAKEETVRITYNLTWHADRLHLTLENQPSDRNYVVYVVVEEKLPRSGQVLHTAVPVPMNGQLTYVPQKFFDDEREAFERVERVMKDFNRKYSETVEAGPLDPVIGWARPGDFASTEAVERMVVLAKEHQPELLRQVMETYMQTAQTGSELPSPSNSPSR